MGEGTVVAVLGVLAALIGMLGGTAWLNRRNLARLTSAQATEVDAKAVEITDRIARDWLTRLEGRIKEVEGTLEKERRIRRAAIAFIERLLDWVADRHPEKPTDLPRIPEDLAEYLDDETH